MTAAKKNSIKNLWPDQQTEQPTQPRGPKSDQERGLKQVIFRMSVDGKRQLDIIAATTGRQKQELLCEAWNDFLQKNGYPRTA